MKHARVSWGAFLLLGLASMQTPAWAATIAGNVDSVQLNLDGSFSVVGWACAVGRTTPLALDAYFGGAWPEGVMQGRTVANLASEAAVGQACKTVGSGHRFEFRFPQHLRSSFLSRKIYLHAIDPDRGPNPLIAGSGSFAVPGGPIGNVDRVQLNVDGSFAVSGWACALGRAEPISVDVYLGGPWPTGTMKTRVLANLPSETAVAQTCKSGGTAHRFQGTLAAGLRSSAAGQKIYVHAINPGSDVNPLILGSGSFPVPGGPYGNVDRVQSNADGSVSIYGWACAIGKPASISVDLYLGAPWPQGAAKGRVAANLSSEPAVAQACRSGGQAHRFRFTLPAADRLRFATDRIFVHGLNPETGPNALIGGSGEARLPFDPAATPPDELRIANTGRYLFGTYVFPGWTRNSMADGPLDEGWKVTAQWPTILNPAPLAAGADQPKRPVLNLGAYRGLFYDDSDPRAVDWMIKWGVESGVSLFVYDWYWTGAKDPAGTSLKPSLERPLEQGFLKSKYLARYPNDIHFAILWANHYNWCYQPDCSRLPDPAATREQMRSRNDAMIDYAIANYFKRPQYLRIENKPVLIAWSFHDLKLGLAGEQGVAELKETLSRWQLKARSAGLEGLYLLVVGSTDKMLPELGVQGLTAYSYAPHALQAARDDTSRLRGTPVIAKGKQRWRVANPTSLADLISDPEIGRVVSYETFTETYKQLWADSYALNRNYLPVLSPGWDDTPWKCRPVYRSDLNATAMWAACVNLLLVTHPGTKAAYKDGYRKQLVAGKEFLDTHSTLEASTSKGPRKLILNEAWDEWGEGSVLAPTQRWGFSLLDSILEVFGQR